jgi:nitrate reductase cytochrome c-type subunit
MENDPTFPLIHPPAQAPQSPKLTSRRWLRWLGIGVVGLGAIFLSYKILRDIAQNGNAQDLGDHKAEPPPPLFVGWNKPDLAIVISGQMYGYLQPCGCSEPQLGGLARRNQLILALKSKDWPVTAIDLGDIASTSGPQQKLKYVYAMKALKMMGYQVIGIGKNEFNMPLIDALAEYSIQDPLPRPLAANLHKTEKGEMFYALNVRPGDVFAAGHKNNLFTLGVLGGVETVTDPKTGEVTAPQIMPKLQAQVNDILFLDKQKTLPKTLQIIQGINAKKGVDIGIMLYQGDEAEAQQIAGFLHDARLKDPSIAPVHILFCQTKDEIPPAFLKKGPNAPNTSIVTIGHKGRHVGVLGLWKTPNGIEIKYQLVAMGPEFQTKPGFEKTNAVMALLEKYAEEVRDGNYLSRFPRADHETQSVQRNAVYVGSDQCLKCHKQAAKVWQASKHTQAFTALVNAKNPGLRHFDGECVKCHTVGFEYFTGYNDPPKGLNPQQIQQHNKKLEHVGCESCHGPGSIHVQNQQKGIQENLALLQLINPFRASEKELDPQTPAAVINQLKKNRERRIDDFCQKCHDMENDVHWDFNKNWPKIAH